MVLSCVLLESIPSLLNGIPVDVTDVAVVSLILFQLLLLLSLLGEGINHDTRDDIAEEEPEEHEVDAVVGESGPVELPALLPYHPRDIHVQDAGGDCPTHLVDGLVLVDVLHVVAEPDQAEDEHECHSHHTHDCQGLDVGGDGLEDVLEDIDHDEDVKQLESEEVGLVESPEY